LTQAKTVIARLRELLLKNEFEEGSKLNAGVLAERLGVSRTPIRNALAVLESEGVVGYTNNRGYSARELGIQDVLDALEVRASLAATVARVLAERGLDSETVNYLQRQLDKAREILEKGHWSEVEETIWYNHNYDFHRALLRATQNRYLLKAVTFTLVVPLIGDSLKSSAFRIKPAENTGDIPPAYLWESQVQLERLLKAIEAGDVDRAQNMMSEHIFLLRDRVLDISDSDSVGVQKYVPLPPMGSTEIDA